jgi:AbiTii
VSSVVIELQREALDRSVRVSDLLRKALVVARKLSLRQFQTWIENELNGYSNGDDVPEYREMSGEVRGWNPVRGWIPIIFEDPEEGEILSHRKCGQSIAEIEHMLEGKNKSSSLQMPFPQEIQRRLSRGFPFETQVTLVTQYSGMARIIDSARTIVLNWALKLEEDGISGEGLSFTEQEKKVAEQSPQNVTNFFGPVQSPQIQQGSMQPVQVSASVTLDMTAVASVVPQIRQALGSMELPEDRRSEAEAEVSTLESQIKSPKPKASIIREGLESLRRILEGAGGGAAGQLLVEVGKILAGVG